MKPEYLGEMMEEDPTAEKQEQNEEMDLDWIELENGWQLVICDEEAWAEMGLTLTGFSRIIDRLQAATAGSPEGEATLTQGEIEAAITDGVIAPSGPRGVS